MSALKTQVSGDHYKGMAIQPVEFIHANNIPYCEANAIKYLCRWRKKGGIADLEKAKHYIDLLIELESKSNQSSVESNNDGWIEWNGEKCPVDGHVMVEIIMRDLEHGKCVAGDLVWEHEDHPSDIILYRVVKD